MLSRKLFPALAWALFILALCALPGRVIPQLTFLDWLKPDKIVHLFLFGVLSFLLIKAFTEQVSVALLAAHPAVSSILISSIYGVLIELLQEYCFSGRTGDVFDAMADSLGALAGLWFFNYWQKRNITKGNA
jgi:VanZ family protein